MASEEDNTTWRASCAKLLATLRDRCGVGTTSAPQSMHSADRLLAFNDYCASTPRTRVSLVLVLYCVPALLLVLALDAIPLQDPGAGWKANPSHWVRCGITFATVCGTMLAQIQSVLPEIAFTSTQLLATTLSVVVGETAVLMLLAEYWMFPLAIASGGLPFAVILNAFVVTKIGASNRSLLKMCFQYYQGINAYMAMLAVYPANNAVFLSLDGIAQLALVQVLPLIKHGFN